MSHVVGGVRLAISATAFLLAVSAVPARSQGLGATFTKLYSFGGSPTDGIQPTGGLTFGADGDLYGATTYGGANNFGTIFKITPSGSETVLHSFNGQDGIEPGGSLLLASDGNFYGTTTLEGPVANLSYGTVFKMTPDGTLTTLHSFDGADGWLPNGGLVTGPDGYFYGTTASGGENLHAATGTAFKIDESGDFATIHDFGVSSMDGQRPSSLVLGPDGNLYGTTTNGGTVVTDQNGTVFQLTPSGAETLLYSFGTNYEGGPFAALTVGADGNLYGTTQNGGMNYLGSVFMVDPVTNAFDDIYTFPDDTDSSGNNAEGLTPCTPMILGTDGNFYGLTTQGGVNGNGTVFQVTPTGQLTTIYSFPTLVEDQYDEDSPIPGALVEAPDGTLYGTTFGCGDHNEGMVYKITVPSLMASAVRRFDFNRDGHPDLLWYNTASGQVSRWLMNDQTVVNYGSSFAQIDPSTGWQPVAAPDANGDGYPDLLWWNNQTGDLSVWTLQDQTVTSYGAALNQIKNTNWTPVAVADNAPLTGNWTMVLQNKADGNISRWMVSGQTVTSAGPTIASLGPNSPWQVVGAPDLDGDGKSDLLFWNDQTGEVSWWSCDLANSQVLAYHGDIAVLADTSWHLVGSEDTNGDGHPDLVWWNAKTGEVSHWLMGAGASGGGPTVTGYGADTTQVPDTTWQPTALR